MWRFDGDTHAVVGTPRERGRSLYHGELLKAKIHFLSPAVTVFPTVPLLTEGGRREFWQQRNDIPMVYRRVFRHQFSMFFRQQVRRDQHTKSSEKGCGNRTRLIDEPAAPAVQSGLHPEGKSTTACRDARRISLPVAVVDSPGLPARRRDRPSGAWARLQIRLAQARQQPIRQRQ